MLLVEVQLEVLGMAHHGSLEQESVVFHTVTKAVLIPG